MDIRSLLNPRSPESPGPCPAEHFTVSPTPTPSTPQSSSSSLQSPTIPHESFTAVQRTGILKSTMPSAKKADKGVRARVQTGPAGPVNYPPVQAYDPVFHAAILTKLVEFKYTPLGSGPVKGIYEPLTIAFGHPARDLYTKTRREQFRVFTYRFIKDNIERFVTWDYEIGLVRVAHIFKACKFGKTTPAKALESTKGFKNVSMNITGGEMGGQGYWLPFQCARALCAKFCYDIKEILTPIFGIDFVDDCVPLGDDEQPDFCINEAFVREARKQQKKLRDSSARKASIKKLINNTQKSQEITRNTIGTIGGKRLRSRKAKPAVKPETAPEYIGDDNEDSEYKNSTEEDYHIEDNYQIKKPSARKRSLRKDSTPLSPKSKPAALSNSGWAAVNRPRTSGPSKGTVAISMDAPSSSSSSRGPSLPVQSPPNPSERTETVDRSSEPVRPPSERGNRRTTDTVATTSTKQTTSGRDRSPSQSESDDEDIQLPVSKRRRATDDGSGKTAAELEEEHEVALECARLLLEFSRGPRLSGSDQSQDVSGTRQGS